MPVKNLWSTIRPHLSEIALFGLVLLLATAVRLWQLDSVPAGLHFDEAIDLDQSLRIVDGARPIYIQEGWGREALYYYWVALLLPWIHNNMLALRLTAVLCSLGMIVSSYWLARRTVVRSVALLTAVLLSLNYWSLFTARFGVRHMSLPFMLGLAVLAFFWAWQPKRAPKSQIAAYGLAGFLLGLTLYTYQSARFAPFIFLFFGVYLFLWHRPRFWAAKTGWLVYSLTAVLVAAPLFVATQQANIELETRDWLVEPMLHLLAGDPSLVWQNGLDTLAMFSIAGDPLVAYNLPGRPVFVPVWISLFLYIGLAVAIKKWRQPIYPFLLIWLLVMLAPTVLTTSAPNYNRAIAAQVPAMILTAVGMAHSSRWLQHRFPARQTAVFTAVALTLSLAWLGWASWRDYFGQWPQQPLIPIQYNVAVSVAARTLDAQADGRAVLVNSRSIEDADPIIFDAILNRTDLDVRWVDTGMALVMPAQQSETRILLGTERWIDAALSEFAQMEPQPYFSHDDVALYQTHADHWQAPPATAVYALPITATTPLAPFAQQPLTNPTFADRLQLQAAYLPTAVGDPNQPFTLLTDWHILQDGEAGSLAFFVHLLDDDGNLVAQQDGLGFPPHSWQAGDRLVHLHRLQPSQPLAAGDYWIQLGLYRRETGQRWLLAGDQHDRLLLGPFTIRP